MIASLGNILPVLLIAAFVGLLVTVGSFLRGKRAERISAAREAYLRKLYAGAGEGQGRARHGEQEWRRGFHEQG